MMSTLLPSVVMQTLPVGMPSTPKVTHGSPIIIYAENSPWNLLSLTDGTIPFPINDKVAFSANRCDNMLLIEHRHYSCWEPWRVTHDKGGGSSWRQVVAFGRCGLVDKTKIITNRGAWHLVSRYVPQLLLEPCPYLDPNTHWPPTLTVALHHGQCVRPSYWKTQLDKLKSLVDFTLQLLHAICGCYLVVILDRTTRFEGFVVRCGFKKKTHKETYVNKRLD